MKGQFFIVATVIIVGVLLGIYQSLQNYSSIDLSEPETYSERRRRCDMGYLRTPYRRQDGSLGYRCAAEPEADYVAKGGKLEDTEGRKCLCNALLANIDLAQFQRNEYTEKPLVTIGDDVNSVRRFMKPGSLSYTASDVVRTLLA